MRNGIAAVDVALNFNTMESMFFPALHWSLKVHSKICSYSTNEIVPLRYKLHTPEKDVGSEIRRYFGTDSRICPVVLDYTNL